MAHLFRALKRSAKRLKRRLSTIDLTSEDIRFEYGFGFGKLYHPFVEALRTASEEGVRRSLISHYEFMLEHTSSFSDPTEKLPLQSWKHGPERLQEYLIGAEPMIFNFLCDRSLIDHFAGEKARNLLGIVDSIDTHGFNPEAHPGEGIRGVRINDHILLLGGQHRAVALHVLGYRRFPVTVRAHRNLPARCKSNEVSRLPLVESGFIAEHTARRILDRISHGFTHEMALKAGVDIDVTARDLPDTVAG